MGDQWRFESSWPHHFGPFAGYRISSPRSTIMLDLRTVRNIFVLCCLLLVTNHGHTEELSMPRFNAIAFDYFVIFDANSIIPSIEKVFPGKGADFAKIWRTKQFEYSFLRSITNRHADFFKVTEDALVYTAEAMKLDLGSEARRELLDAYLRLKPWPDAVDALRRLKASGIKIITISNFSQEMLRSNADRAGITALFDELLSTEVNGTYKPEPNAYELGMQRLNLKKEDILFAAFGGWDAYGAKTFGYTTYWVNRFNLPLEKLGVQADQSSNNMEGLLNFVLGKNAGSSAPK